MMKKLCKNYLTVALCFFAGTNLFAQTMTQGTDFWLAFGQYMASAPSAPSSGLTLKIQIVTADAAANVHLEYTEMSSTDQYKYKDIPIDANTIHTVDLNEYQRKAVYNSSSAAISDKSVHITSDVPVSVYALIYTKYRSDATNVFPAGALGTDYYHISYEVNGESDKDAILTVATEDNTTVTLRNSSNNLVENRTLNKGQTYYYQSGTDMTGYHLTSTKPVACFAAHQGTMIPDGAKSNLDNLFQQLAPVHSWGKKFLVPDIGIANQDPLILRIVASQANTSCDVTTGGTQTTVTLNKGEYKEFSITDAAGSYISSSKPVAVCSYLLSYGKDKSGTGGPAQVWIPPVEQATVKTTISPFYHDKLTDHYAIVITPENSKNATTLTVSGTKTSSLSDATWYDNSGYSYTKLVLANAPYTFENPAGVIVLVASVGTSNAYYMLGGASVNNLNMMFTVNGNSYQNITGKTLCSDAVSLAATVEYAKNPLNLKWFDNNQEIVAARNKLTYNATLSSGNHTVRMDVEDQNGVIKSVSANFKIDKPVVSGPSEILVGQTANLSPSTGGTWRSSNTAIATVSSSGLIRGVAKGQVTFTFTSTADCKAYKTVTVIPPVDAKNDTTFVSGNPVTLDVLANDGFGNCTKNGLTVEPVSGTGVKHGSLTVNPDKTFTYTPDSDFAGVDNVEYRIRCGTSEDVAKVYFFVLKPVYEKNACPEEEVLIEMEPAIFEYYWYDSNGASLNQTPQNSITVTKDDSDIQSWQVVAKYKGKTSDRYTVSISKSENCGLSGCPVTIINNQNNTVCTGTQYTLDASLNCSGFSGENRIGTRWEYKHGKNAEWSTLDTDILTVEPNMHSTYVIDNVAEIDDGDYRLTVYTLGSPSTSVVSNTVTLSVIKSYKAPDFRAMIDPSSSPAKVYLSTFIDVANVESVKWSGVGNFINLINDETGEFDAQNLQPGRVYTYRYTAMSECGPSTAKAYVLSSTAKLPVKNNREIYICKDLESSKYVNLNQILGMDHRGTWKYIDDEYSIVPFFISESTEKYGFSTIFNALGAYEEVYAMTDDGTYPSKYDHPENPKTKMFKFQYTSVDGTVVDFTITVGE